MIEVNKVIVLENGEEYLVLDKTEIDNVTYYYIAKINDTRTDIENNYKLVTMDGSDGNYTIVEVTGEDRLKEILPLFDKKS